MYFFKKILPEDKPEARVKNRRVHMANERTFLAWIRTCIGIMAFGFMIERFVLHSPGGVGWPSESNLHPHSHSIAFLGVLLVVLGAVTSLLATYRYLKTERDIINDSYQPSLAADVLIGSLLCSIAVLLVIFLLRY